MTSNKSLLAVLKCLESSHVTYRDGHLHDLVEDKVISLAHENKDSQLAYLFTKI